MEDVIERFLSVSSGDDGWADNKGGLVNGTGFGDGIYTVDDCDDAGNGYGYGNSEDDIGSTGDGTGMGYGRGIISYEGQKVYIIDGLQTLIDSIHGNYAIGKILHSDLTIHDCYIAKVDNYFAHGKTLKKAVSDATAKYNRRRPIEDRIADFIKTYPSLDCIANHRDLYEWHNILTGSCTFGRDEFAKEHNLDKDNGSMTIREFIDLTAYSYGSDIIRKLKKEYETSVE